jgi:hypothetical protein
MLENLAPRRMFGAKMDEVSDAWREVDNEELRDLYSSPSAIKLSSRRRRDGPKCRTNWREEEYIYIGYCGGARGKESTRKTKTMMS